MKDIRAANPGFCETVVESLAEEQLRQAANLATQKTAVVPNFIAATVAAAESVPYACRPTSAPILNKRTHSEMLKQSDQQKNIEEVKVVSAAC